MACITYESSDWLNKRLCHVEDVWNLKIEHAVVDVLIALVKYGLQKVFTVDRIHKHYELRDNMLPTTTLGNTGSLVVVGVMEQTAVPEELRQNMASLLDNPGGILHVIDTIRRLGMERHIGLSFRVDRAFGVDPNTHHLHEETLPLGKQRILVRPGTYPKPEDDMLLTAWITEESFVNEENFDKETFMRVSMFCGRCCYGKGQCCKSD